MICHLQKLSGHEEEGIGAGSGHLAGSTAGMKLRICEKISFGSTLLARKHM